MEYLTGPAPSLRNWKELEFVLVKSAIFSELTLRSLPSAFPSLLFFSQPHGIQQPVTSHWQSYGQLYAPVLCFSFSFFYICLAKTLHLPFLPL